MYRTRQIINDYKDDFPEFQYYHNIIDKIEKNVKDMPDVTIESCKALVEGSSKTILKRLGVSYIEKGRDADSSKMLLKKALNNIPRITPHDPEFITRSCELVSRMAEIRNRRGDISKGRPSPKEEQSDRDLAELILQVTDGVMPYLLKIYFNANFSEIDEVNYNENINFNNYLDQDKDLDGIIYSKALFEQDPVAYRAKLDDYLSSQNE